MKTIEEGSKEYSKSMSEILNKKPFLLSEIDYIIENAYKKGAEDAQRWISVEDELPSIGDHILIKLKRDKLKIWRIFNEDDRILVANYATHWRPIEIK